MDDPYDEVDDIRPFLSAGHVGLDAWAPVETVPDTRDYLLTGGRTDGGRAEVRIETVVSPTDAGRGPLPTLTREQFAIVRCAGEATRSVSEIASATGLSLGVTRVLVGDLVADGLLNQSSTAQNTIRNAAFLERLITGVKSL